jgi:aspartate-semialdehyde dehydrogenase
MAGRDRNEARTLHVAVVGATGAVGTMLFRQLEARRFPVARLRALASGRSVGRRLVFRGEAVEVEAATPENLGEVDLVFFAATGSLSKELAPEAVARGAVVIDKSSTWRMEPDVPLVVPEINAAALDGHRGIVASPNCTTIGAVMVLEPLRRRAGLRRVVVTTFQAVSGAGEPGREELEGQLAATARGDAPLARTFAAPIAHNVVPVCETLRDDGYTSEELKLLHETRKILGLPGLAVSMTCTRVPVPVGHAAALLVETERPLDVVAAREALAEFPGVVVVDDPRAGRFPTPRDVEGRDEVLVGRLRRDLGSDALWLWEVSDNLRKGAATNAVQIAEALRERGRL